MLTTPVPCARETNSLNRLHRVFNKYAEVHIRNRFESDANDYYFAPTFLDLRRLQEHGELIKLKGPPRDMDAPLAIPNGSKRPRKPIEQSKTLEKEVRWLTSYLRESPTKMPSWSRIFRGYCCP